MKAKLGHEEFVRLAVTKLRLNNYKGIHSVYSGFNEAFKAYFEGINPIEVTAGSWPGRERSPCVLSRAVSCSTCRRTDRS
jgi:hypothetical protein